MLDRGDDGSFATINSTGDAGEREREGGAERKRKGNYIGRIARAIQKNARFCEHVSICTDLA